MVRGAGSLRVKVVVGCMIFCFVCGFLVWVGGRFCFVILVLGGFVGLGVIGGFDFSVGGFISREGIGDSFV